MHLQVKIQIKRCKVPFFLSKMTSLKLLSSIKLFKPINYCRTNGIAVIILICLNGTEFIFSWTYLNNQTKLLQNLCNSYSFKCCCWCVKCNNNNRFWVLVRWRLLILGIRTKKKMNWNIYWFLCAQKKKCAHCTRTSCCCEWKVLTFISNS